MIPMSHEQLACMFQVKDNHIYISLVFIWLVGPVEKFLLLWFLSGIVDGTCYVCMSLDSPATLESKN